LLTTVVSKINSVEATMPQQPLAQVPKDATWQWQDHGSCREADEALFFHPPNERGLARIRRDRAAKAVCVRCPVRIECADYAIRSREPYGVWGGLTEEDRERIYARIAIADYPRSRGDGALMCADEIADAVSASSLGIA
jgi:WhiB family redox-sensing transcriptional regulator